MNYKPLDAITNEDIDALVTNAVQESKALDFKVAMTGGGDADKKEFLADVASFANASGGDLVFGIREANGAAEAVVGLTDFDEDATRLRLEQSIQSGIAPRLPGVQMHAIAGTERGPVFIVRVSRSWCGPHMVTFKNHSRFYSRHSAGKFQLDVGEIRAAFAQSEELPARIRRWRDGRVGQIMANECAVPLEAGGRLVMHIVPFDSFANELQFSADEMLDTARRCAPPGAGGWSHRINVDGVVTFDGSADGSRRSESYCQVYRSGRVEAVNGGIVGVQNNVKFIGSIAYEQETVRSLTGCLESLQALGVSPPLAVSISLTGTLGVHMGLGPRYRGPQSPIDRDPLVLPHIIIDEYGLDAPKLLRPLFDGIWNACGIPRSLNYNEAGEWAPR